MPWGLLVLFICIGAFLLAYWIVLNGGMAFVGMNDFLCFYTAGSFVGTDHFYDLDRMQQLQLQRTGIMGDNLVFVRLPYLTLLFAPLSHLPYHSAYLLWQLVSLIVLVIALRFWRVPSAGVAALFACISLPVIIVFATGQDVNFLLLWVSLAVYLQQQGKETAAGGMLALCTAKFHLFVFLPLLLWRHRSAAFLRGLLAVGAGLFALSFVAGGPHWIAAYRKALADPRPHVGAQRMPNLHGLITVWHWPAALEWVFAAMVLVGVICAVRRGDFLWQLSVVLCGGMLVSHHAYAYDCVLLLPVALTAMTRTNYRAIRFTCIALLTPAPYLLGNYGYPATPLLCSLLLIGMALQRTLAVSVVAQPVDAPLATAAEAAAA